MSFYDLIENHKICVLVSTLNFIWRYKYMIYPSVMHIYWVSYEISDDFFKESFAKTFIMVLKNNNKNTIIKFFFYKLFLLFLYHYIIYNDREIIIKSWQVSTINCYCFSFMHVYIKAELGKLTICFNSLNKFIM